MKISPNIKVDAKTSITKKGKILQKVRKMNSEAAKIKKDSLKLDKNKNDFVKELYFKNMYRVNSDGKVVIKTDESLPLQYQYDDKSVYETGVLHVAQFGIKEDIELEDGVYFSKSMYKNKTKPQIYDRFQNENEDTSDNQRESSLDFNKDMKKMSRGFSSLGKRGDLVSDFTQNKEVVFIKGQPFISPSKDQMSKSAYQKLSDRGLIYSGKFENMPGAKIEEVESIDAKAAWPNIQINSGFISPNLHIKKNKDIVKVIKIPKNNKMVPLSKRAIKVGCSMFYF